MVKRALVVRSGERPFPRDPKGSIEILEAVSHDVEPLSIGLHELFVPSEWAVFTSRIAVRRVFEDPETARRFRDALARGRVVAVGEQTAAALAAAGRPADLTAEGSAETVLAMLPSDLANQRVVLPTGDDASGRLPVELARRGALVERAVLYGKTPRAAEPSLETVIRGGEVFAFCATSPSAARWLIAGLSAAGLEALAALPGVTLGPATSTYLKRKGVSRVETSTPPSFERALEVLAALAEPGAKDPAARFPAS